MSQRNDIWSEFTPAGAAEEWPGTPVQQPRSQLGLGSGMQSAAEGVASAVGAPVDLANAALGLGAAATNAIAGTNLQAPAEPAGGSARFSRQYREGVAEGGPSDAYFERKRSESFLESLIPDSPFRILGSIAGALGAKPVDYEAMPAGEKLAFNTSKAGAMLATGGGMGAMRVGAAEAASPIGQLLTETVAPVRQATARTAVGDLGAAGGIAAGQTAVDENRDALDRSGATGKVVETLAPIAGGLAGGLASVGGQAAMGRAVGAIRQAVRPDPTLPIDPGTGQPVAPRIADRAASELQGAAINPAAAARTLADNVAGLRADGIETLPVAGGLAGDIGLQGKTDAVRRAGGHSAALMAQRELDLQAEAKGRLAGIAADGNPNAPAAFAGQRATALRDEATQAVTAAEQAAEAHAREQAAAASGLARAADRREEASRALDTAIVDGGLRPAVAQKNALFEAAGQSPTPVSPDPLRQAAGRVRSELEAIPAALRGGAEPTDVLRAIESLGADGQPVTLRTLMAIRPHVAAAEQQARSAGNYPLADHLRTIKGSLGEPIEQAARQGDQSAAAALDYHRNTFAPVWDAGPGDAAAMLRRDFNLDPRGRTESPPSQTASRFLRTPEDAASLARAIEASNDPAAGRAAVREALTAELARTGAVDAASGRLNLISMRKWVAKKRGVLSALGLEAEFDGITRQSAAHQGRADALAAEVAAARDRMKLTEADIQNGALGFMLDRSPERLVSDLMASRDPRASFRDVVSALKDTPGAMSGFARALVAHIEAGPTADRLATTLDTFGPQLNDVVGPEGMLALRVSQRQLEAGRRGPSVSPGPAAEQGAPLARAADAALSLAPGGSGISGRLFRALASAVPDRTTPAVNALVGRSLASDPVSLGALLTRPLPAARGRRANWRANNRAAFLTGVQSAQHQDD